MLSITPILTKLTKAQAVFLCAADAIPTCQWTRKPCAEEWSAAEVVAHLVMVERAIIGGADRVTQKAPHPVPFLKRMNLPMWLASTRVIRLKSPIPVDPALMGNKEEVLCELRAARERALAFLDETRNGNLNKYRWPHPFLGSLNVYEWFEMIAAHQLRHTKQMKEICARLPKVVEISQN